MNVWKLWWLLVVLILVGLFYWWWEQTATDPASKTIDAAINTEIDTAKLFSRADELYRAGDYEQSIAFYDRILELEPANKRALQLSGHTYRYWGKFAAAEKRYLAALEVDDQDAWLYTDLGKLYRNMGRHEQAEAAFQKSIAIDPTFPDTYSYGLGYLYFEQERFSEAEAMFKKALELNPTSEIAHSGLADTYREMGLYDEAHKMYEQVFALNPKSESYLGIAWLHIYEENYQEAIAACQKFLDEIRIKAEVYYTMGVAYEGLSDTTQARTAFAEAVRLNPDNELFRAALNRATD